MSHPIPSFMARQFILIVLFAVCPCLVVSMYAQAPDQDRDQAATGNNPERKSVQILHESQGSPPETPAYLDPGARSPGARIQRGPYVSVQVNVDAFGQNIVGDAANEPSIAVDPNDPDRVVIGWRQFDTISSDFRQAGKAYTLDGGQTWTFGNVLTPGTFRSDPVLDYDVDGNFYYFSLKGDFTCDMFISNDGGVSWQGPFSAYGGDKNWMTIDRTSGMGQGNIYCTWTGMYNFIRSTDGGFSYESPIASEAYWGTLSVGPDGKLYISGYYGGNSCVVQRSSNAQNAAVTPTWDHTAVADLGGEISYYGGPNPGGLLGQVWIATNHEPGWHNGEVYVLASVDPPGGDPLDVHFIRSTDDGVTWSSPVRVNDDPVGNNAWQWFGTMSVAPNGRIDVVWNDTRNTGSMNLCELYYTYSYDGGATWAKSTQVTPAWNSVIGWPQQNKIGDYYDMVSFDDYAHLAYAATFNGEQDVYYVKLYPDFSLDADKDQLSSTTGDTIQFSLDAGAANQGRKYLLLGSTRGTSPGFPLPGGLATLPLNWDGLTDFIISYLNTSIFTNFLGVLDSQGMAGAQLNAPALPPGAIGTVMHFAYCLNHPFDFASKPVEVLIVP